MTSESFNQNFKYNVLATYLRRNEFAFRCSARVCPCDEILEQRCSGIRSGVNEHRAGGKRPRIIVVDFLRHIRELWKPYSVAIRFGEHKADGRAARREEVSLADCAGRRSPILPERDGGQLPPVMDGGNGEASILVSSGAVNQHRADVT